jgi:peptidyl-prolyl cis-trans isomerase C
LGGPYPAHAKVDGIVPGRGLSWPVVAFAVVLLAMAAVCRAQENNPGTAARVNGVTISNETLMRNYRENLAQSNVNIVMQRNSARMDQLRRETLNLLIEKELVWQAAQKKGIAVGEDEVDKAVAELRAEFPTAEGFSRRLANEGYTEASYREHTKRLLAARRYASEIGAAAAQVGEDEIETFYRENTARLTVPEQVHARQILLRIPPEAGPAQKKALRTRLADLRRKIQRGADFAELARRHSDGATATAGGDMGTFARNEMPKDVVDVAFSLKSGEMSDIVATPDSLFILRVEDRTAAHVLPLAEVRGRLRDYVSGQKAERAIRDEIERLRSEAKIEVLLPM